MKGTSQKTCPSGTAIVVPRLAQIGQRYSFGLSEEKPGVKVPSESMMLYGSLYPVTPAFPAEFLPGYCSPGSVFEKMPRYFFIWMVLCLPPAWLSAQVDTLLDLPTVELAAPVLRTQSIGGRMSGWSASELSGQQQQNLGEWLSRQGGLFVKSYGNGSIATTSIRGGSAGHTAVLWNGLPIQSPMLGQLDFSLFPLSFIDDVQINYGGNSAAWGSGAVGGLIELENHPPADSTRRMSLRSAWGSFGFRDYQGQIGYRAGPWAFRTRLFYRNAKNDFPYRKGPDQEESRQSNAGLEQLGLLQSLYWNPAPNQELALHLWAQQSERGIPPTTVQNQSLARQADAFLRSALHWKMIGKQTIWQARLALFRETIDYEDEQILLRAFTGFWTARAEVEGLWSWQRGEQLHLGLAQSWMTAHAPAYSGRPTQFRSAPFLVYRHQLGAWSVQLNLRQEIVDRQLLPLTPGLGITYQLAPEWSVRGKVSRNYRLPTLNDLYWQPGGNPDLLPESGWSEEIGIDWSRQEQQQKWSVGLTLFNRNIKNWILWSRPEGARFWSSNNITEVWSRGIEPRLRWQRQLSHTRLEVVLGYDYIRSTNQVAVSSPKLEPGEQLIYIPEHQAFAHLQMQWKQFHFQYQHTYTGPVASINVGTLAAYHIGHAGIQYATGFSRADLSFFLQINNLWDADYRVIERQPMPGRHFQFGMQLHIHQKK